MTAVLVMAEGSPAGGVIERTLRWALDVAPEATVLAVDGPPIETPAAVATLAQEGNDLGERLAKATREAFRRHPGRLIVVGVNTPLTPEHADAALKQLDAGADVVFGPSDDGGYYLLALARPLPELFELGRDAWDGGRRLELSLTAAWSRGRRTALIHPEHRVALTASRPRRPLAIPLLVVGGSLWLVARLLRAARGRD